MKRLLLSLMVISLWYTPVYGYLGSVKDVSGTSEDKEVTIYGYYGDASLDRNLRHFDARLLSPEQNLLVSLMKGDVKGVQIALQDGAKVDSNTRNLVMIAVDTNQHDIANILLRAMSRQGISLDGHFNYYDNEKNTGFGQLYLLQNNPNYYNTNYLYSNQTLKDVISTRMNRYTRMAQVHFMEFRYKNDSQNLRHKVKAQHLTDLLSLISDSSSTH